MSSDVVIRAEGLGKKYVIGHQSSERYTALRDVIARSAKGFARTAGEMLRGRPIYSGDELEEFWALKDVSFEIKRGDVVGIIGRNGAGKSTLLKVLSRITEPSEGRVEIKGRVASLLEVGTGFHPELTGRENIYLNGAILGMTREEIRRKFDEIVDFAGVEKFLDTPVKRYSSGMYVRLAFAVAAHLEPEILIVDEVLAVGDAEFQKKCLGKMQEVAGHGRTVLFVSHNMGAITTLCAKGLLLAAGTIGSHGSVEHCIRAYLSTGQNDGRDPVHRHREPIYNESCELVSISQSIETPDGNAGLTPASIRLVVNLRDEKDRELAVLIEDQHHHTILTTHISDSLGFVRGPGLRLFEIQLPSEFLKSGYYHLTFSSFDPASSQFYDVVNHVPFGEIVNYRFCQKISNRPGRIHVPLRWSALSDAEQYKQDQGEARHQQEAK